MGKGKMWAGTILGGGVGVKLPEQWHLGPDNGVYNGKKYAQTAEQLVLGLVKGKGSTTAEINRAWKDAGRTGRADNTLNKMLKDGKLKRTPLKGQKGSTYTLA